LRLILLGKALQRLHLRCRRQLAAFVILIALNCRSNGGSNTTLPIVTA
jgi:hypothetical protein